MELQPFITLSGKIKDQALKLGFDICGIAKYRPLEENRPILTQWCEAGMNDRMGYLARDINKRTDPGMVFPGVKSLIVTGISYYSENSQISPGVPVLSRYVYGKDYHDVIKNKLEMLLDFLRVVVPGTNGKAVADSAPLLEKRWAVEAGLGWQGKHSIVINREIGSFFFIGILMVDIELDYDRPFRDDHCGGCRICIDQCPTKAINGNRTIDARRCISNLTIENRSDIPAEFIPQLGGRVYACDKCQEVCPWNRDIKPNCHHEFNISSELAELSVKEWLNLTKEKFNELFSGTSIERVGFEKFKRNIDTVMSGRET